ncbi:MAG: 1,4-dihydroxy-2-naphthoate polyprenyltransferase [Actinomycetota bacterium]
MTSLDPISGWRMWMLGARIRTLPAAVVPVAVGAACAVGEGTDTAWWRALVALVVALALQVGVNYANDYSDGVRGTDDDRRVGPVRLVGNGLAEPAAVKRAAILAFGVAGVAGAVLALVVGPELFVVGAASLLAGWTYTGGPKPYGYLGLGEVFVFVFFGLVATVGTTYVLLEEIQTLSIVASVAVGLWATALLVINNLRDIPGDTEAGKNTLAVRIGDGATRWVFVVMHLAALGFALWAAFGFSRWGGLLVVLGLGQMIQAIVDVRKGAKGPELIRVLGLTASVQLVSGLGLAIGLALSG